MHAPLLITGHGAPADRPTGAPAGQWRTSRPMAHQPIAQCHTNRPIVHWPITQWRGCVGVGGYVGAWVWVTINIITTSNMLCLCLYLHRTPLPEDEDEDEDEEQYATCTMRHVIEHRDTHTKGRKKKNSTLDALASL